MTYEDCERAMKILQSGNTEQLEKLAEELPHFPECADSFLGRPWITNAIDVGSLQAIEWMLSRGVTLDIGDDDGYTPLHSAIERENADKYQVLELLLASKAPVDKRGIHGYTPAHLAAARNDVKALKLIASYGADLSIRTIIDEDATPLEEARNRGSSDAVAYLESLSSFRVRPDDKR